MSIKWQNRIGVDPYVIEAIESAERNLTHPEARRKYFYGGAVRRNGLEAATRGVDTWVFWQRTLVGIIT